MLGGIGDQAVFASLAARASARCVSPGWTPTCCTGSARTRRGTRIARHGVSGTGRPDTVETTPMRAAEATPSPRSSSRRTAATPTSTSSSPATRTSPSTALHVPRRHLEQYCGSPIYSASSGWCWCSRRYYGTDNRLTLDVLRRGRGRVPRCGAGRGRHQRRRARRVPRRSACGRSASTCSPVPDSRSSEIVD